MTAIPKCELDFDGQDCFVVLDGVKIAKRGHLGTPHAGQWISIEPGYAVYGPTPTNAELVVERDGVKLQ